MMRSRFLAFVCLPLLLCASAYAQNRRSAVSLDGLDTNSCTVPDPCRTFGVAIAATASNGEIIVLKSGGYGPFTIDKAVSIISAQGIHTAIAPTIGTAITVQAGAFDRVVVRGLYLNSQGGDIGIDFISGESLHVENTVISGFELRGINVVRADAVVSQLSVKDSIIRNGRINGGQSPAAVFLQNSTTGRVEAALDGSHLGKYWVGLWLAGNARATIRDSVAAYNAYGLASSAITGTTSALNAEDVVVTFSSQSGLFVGDGNFAGGAATARVSNTLLTGSITGVEMSTNGTAYLAFCTVTGNSTGLNAAGSRISLGNNRVFDNTTNGTFSSSLPQQ